MKSRLLVTCAAFVLFLFFVTKSKADIISGPFINPNNGHTYYLLGNVAAASVPNPFDAGQAEAVTLGGNLATINDITEDQWVFSTFDSLAVAANPLSIRKSLLVGLTDRSVEGTFEWISGEPLSYTNWFSGQPQSNTIGEDYVGIALSNNAFINDGKWHDIDFVNGDVVFAVAEVAVPEPSTSVLFVASYLVLSGVRRRKKFFS
mgnify:CR=1 FL=1